MKKKVLAVCFLALLVLAGCGDIKRKEAVTPVRQQFINIATGNVGGTYYVLGGVLAEVLNREIPGFNANAQSTGASVINLSLLSTGKAEIAFVQSDIAYYAQNGLEMFKGKQISNIRALAVLYPEPIHVITLASGGIKKIEDIKGLRVAVGAASSGTAVNAFKIMQAYGIGQDAVKVQYLDFSEAANSLLEGKTDVVFATAGAPTDFIKALAEKEKIFLLPLNYDKLESLVQEYPFYSRQIIARGTYPGQDEDVTTLAVMAVLASNDKVDADMGYKVTSAIYRNLGKLQSIHPAAGMIKKSYGENSLTLTFNEGAAKFLQE